MPLPVALFVGTCGLGMVLFCSGAYTVQLCLMSLPNYYRRIAKFTGPLLNYAIWSCRRCCLGDIAMVDRQFAACLVCDWRFAVMGGIPAFDHCPVVTPWPP